MITTAQSLLEPVPDWILSGWYGNNPDRQQFAIARFRTPVVTSDERAAARAFNALQKARTFACEGCQRFAFAVPTTCFWCRSGASR